MKKFLKILLVLVIMVLIILGCIWAYNYFTKEKTEIIEENEKTYLTEAIFDVENYPRIDGSTATIPLSNAFKKAFTADTEAEVKHNTTHNAYVNLIEGNADIILVTYPSEEEFELAKKAGIELEIIPVVNEGFVFFVNENNPVKSLTMDEIRGIYSGKIKNWKELGGNDSEIIPYQRELNSGSQSGMLELVMKDTQIMEAKKEDIIEGMQAIVNLVSDYDNGENSIGYSYYYYATTMYDDIDSSVTDRIRFVAVDGVEPSAKTIKDGTYPIRTAYYIVINKAEKENSDVRKLVNAMLSDWGQEVAEEAGYVSIK
ncbi:MAG: PstS family phosphate ABC transporter substrate-binding protein [Candidatus Scatovivens sp.]